MRFFPRKDCPRSVRTISLLFLSCSHFHFKNSGIILISLKIGLSSLVCEL